MTSSKASLEMPVETVRQFIRDEILSDSSLVISDDQDLLLSGLLDSLGVVRLASFLEQQFHIEIPPEDLVLENFGSLTQINTYLLSRR